MTRKSWIGVDLDGTMAQYEGWKGAGHIGAPIHAICERIRALLKAGETVKVFTARMSVPTQVPEFIESWTEWSQLQFGQVLEATCSKDYAMIELWDDRAVAVEAGTGRFLSPSSLIR